MNTRRKLLVVLAAATLPKALFAQARSEPLRIAYFSEGTLEKYQPYVDSFRAGLRELGYQEGKNIRIDYYWRGDTIKVFRWMASDIVRSKPDMIVTTCEVSALQRTAAALHMELLRFEAEDERGFERVFGEMRKAKVQAVIDYSGTTVNFPFRRQVTELTTRAKLPSVFYLGELVDDGGLMSYGPNVRDGFRTAASYVDRIAKGKKPAELPV